MGLREQGLGMGSGPPWEAAEDSRACALTSPLSAPWSMRPWSFSTVLRAAA